MRKDDFLDILKDYLKNSFSEDEIMDILRDYEEYFIDGETEGKSEMEIISSLGSPKEIAKELLVENRDKTIRKSKLKSKIDNLYISLKSTSKSLSNKFKINLRDKNHAKYRNKIKFMQVLVTLILLPFVAMIALGTIGFGLSLITSVVAPILLAPFIVSFVSIIPQLKMVVIFGIIAYIGLEILLWQLFMFILKLEKRARKIYLTWIRTNQLYINGSIKKEEMEQSGGLSDEEE